MRTLQEMMGHRDFKTTLIYADYTPSAREAEWGRGGVSAGKRGARDAVRALLRKLGTPLVP
jgi:hypothetical protein